MSLISLRRVQAGSCGGEHSGSVILSAENNVCTCLASTLPFTIVSKGQKMERQRKGKWALLVVQLLRTTMFPSRPLPIYLFQDCKSHIWEGGGGLVALTAWLSQLLQRSEVSSRETSCLFKSIMQNLVFFLFFFTEQNNHRRTDPCT